MSGPGPENAYGPFRVLHQIGAGVLGPVFRAYDPEHDRLVAVKVFRLDVPPERVHRFVGELEQLIAARLTHPAMTAPISSGICGTNAFLAQDYVAGDSLDVVIRDRGRTPILEALRVAAQLAGALDIAALVGIVHGTLHPRDVLISSDETRLTGLGIARALEQAGVAVPLRRPYTAPERIAGAAWDQRADVFGLAALVHELVWGRRPTGSGGEAAATLTEITGAKLDGLQATFARALANDPAARYPDALEFVEALKTAVPGARGHSHHLPVVGRQPGLPLEPEAVASPAPVIRAAETPPFAVVTAPALVRPAIEEPTSIRSALGPNREREPSSTLERARSAVWPLVLALGVGVALGFAGGYGVGAHDRPAQTAAAASVVAAAGHEFRESVVSEPPKSPPDAVRLQPGTTEISAPEVKPPMAASIPKATPRANTDAGRVRLKAETMGRLLVRSTPSGAQVFVDGREYGRTPAAVHELTRGAHRVRVVRDGFVTRERRIFITASRPPQSMTLTLSRAHVAPPSAPRPTTPATFVGTFSVESRPSGAKVFVDSRPVGTTPLVVSDVTAGEHAVRLELDGYRRWTSSVRVVANERGRVTASLEK